MTTPRALRIAALVALPALALSHSAGAEQPGLAITFVPGPVAVAGHEVAVHLAVRNTQQQILCDGLFLTLTWSGTGGSGSSLTREITDLNVWAGTLTIPQDQVRAGHLSYRVTARESCGFLDHGISFTGDTPTKTVSVL